MMKSFLMTATRMLAILAVVVFTGCDDDEPKIYGLKEATKFGWIKLKFEGTRVDGVPFKATETYRYITGFGPTGSSTHRSYEDDGIINHTLRATRLVDPFDSSPANANITLNAIEQNGELVLIPSNFSTTTPLEFDDMVAMRLFVNVGQIRPENIIFSYNEENGKLKLKFTTVIEADLNSTENALTVTGEASVILYKPLD